MSIEGQINIHLQPSNINTQRVSIGSTRPVHAAKVLINKTPEQALSLIPLLFSVCGVAQSRAALVAMQQAMQIPIVDEHEVARDIIVLSENAKEHLLRILIDWPTLFETTQKLDSLSYVGQLVNSFKKALFQNKNAFNLDSQLESNLSPVNDLILKLETYLSDHVFCCSPEEWLNIDSLEQLRQWAETTTDCTPALSLHQICEYGWGSQGHSTSLSLPTLDEHLLSSSMNAHNSSQFIEYPVWNGTCYETNSLGRQNNHPLIKLLHQEFDNGLITRWTARLVELALIPQQMRQLLEGIHKKHQHKNSSTNNEGLAQVEAARGRLIHHIKMTSSDKNSTLIKNYQILAPTEWNFHPQGLISQSLSNIYSKDQKEYELLAHLVIHAIDPCVPYQLKVN